MQVLLTVMTLYRISIVSFFLTVSENYDVVNKFDIGMTESYDTCNPYAFISELNGKVSRITENVYITSYTIYNTYVTLHIFYNTLISLYTFYTTYISLYTFYNT